MQSPWLSEKSSNQISHWLSISHRPEFSQVWVTQTKLMLILSVTIWNYFQRNEELEHGSKEWIQFRPLNNSWERLGIQCNKIKGSSHDTGVVAVIIQHSIVIKVAAGENNCSLWVCRAQATFPGQKHRVISSADSHRPKDRSSQSSVVSLGGDIIVMQHDIFIRVYFHLCTLHGCVCVRGGAR